MSIHVTPITPYGLKWTLLHGGVTCLNRVDVSARLYKAGKRHSNEMLFITMEPRDYIPPTQYNVFLSDVSHNDLVGNISERLATTYLAPGEDVSQEPIKGILYGTNARPMVNLVVSSPRFKKKLNVIFLVDTGSPSLYVCETAMKALGFTDNIPGTFDILFRNITHTAVVSPTTVDGKDGHYKDINLIGATFLTKMRAEVILDYRANLVTLSFN